MFLNTWNNIICRDSFQVMKQQQHNKRFHICLSQQGSTKTHKRMAAFKYIMHEMKLNTEKKIREKVSKCTYTRDKK